MTSNSKPSNNQWLDRVRTGDFSAIPAPFTWAVAQDLALLINGYELNGGMEGFFETANRVRRRREATGEWTGSPLELWTALYHAQRSDYWGHWDGEETSADEASLRDELCETIRKKLVALEPDERTTILKVLATRDAQKPTDDIDVAMGETTTGHEAPNPIEIEPRAGTSLRATSVGRASEESVNRLLAAGFARAGVWRIDSEGSAFLDGEAPREPGVYAFIVEGEVYYVGSAQKGLRSRMHSYKRNQRYRRNSRRIHGEIADTLLQGREIEVFTVVPPPLDWSGLPIDMIAGLEEGLIRRFCPKWNDRGLGRARSP